LPVHNMGFRKNNMQKLVLTKIFNHSLILD
jgi:hypothetical protein